MERYQKGSLEKTKRKNGTVVWTFRWRETVNGKRTRPKKIIGTVEELPTRKAAEQAVSDLRITINAEVAAPKTVNDLIAHYRVHELTPEKKAFSSIENFNGVTARYLTPKWGAHRLTEVRTVAVEEWLEGLSYSPSTKTKIKAMFSVLYSHAIRHEWLTFNPIMKVRTSRKVLRKKDVLEPAEFQALIEELPVRERAMVLLAGSTGLRRSEFIGLRWSDVDAAKMEVAVTKSCFRNRFGKPKTDASKAPVPLHPFVLEALLLWRSQSPFQSEGDFVFASLRMNGRQPLAPDTLLKRHIHPALKRAGITNKAIGFHNFRHSLATWLRALGVDIKVAQELMRHAKVSTTLDIYTRGNSEQKVAANDNVVQMFRKERKAG